MKTFDKLFLGLLVSALLCVTSSCRLAKVHRDIARQNVQVHFQGKVVDQNNQPIAGARVAARVRHWYFPAFVSPYPEGKMIHLDVETAANGSFELRGVTGDAIDIASISKDGYALDRNTNLGYGSVAGTKNAPVILKMQALPR